MRCWRTLLPQELPSPATSEGSWLCQWKKLTSRASYGPDIPPEACSVTTPLILSAWRGLLLSHPHRELVHLFLQGIANGFRIGFASDATDLKPARRNMRSAMLHPEVVDQYLEKEVQEHRVVGPFPKCISAHVNRFGVIPKAHQTNLS